MRTIEKIFYKDSDDPQEILRLYKGSYATVYDETKQEIIKSVIKGLYPPLEWKNIEVLDIGCGGGIFTRFLLDLGAKVTAQDLSPAILKACKIENPEADLVCGDATEINLKKKFDLIFVKDVIEHIKPDDVFLKNMNRHLQKDGHLIINTQNSHSFNYLLEKTYSLLRGNTKWMGWAPDHVRFYNALSLRKKLLQTGFIPIRWFGSYYFPYRALAYFFGKRFEFKIFRAIELLNLWKFFPFNITGWNIGVLAKKIYDI